MQSIPQLSPLNIKNLQCLLRLTFDHLGISGKMMKMPTDDYNKLTQSITQQQQQHPAEPSALDKLSSQVCYRLFGNV